MLLKDKKARKWARSKKLKQGPNLALLSIKDRQRRTRTKWRSYACNANNWHFWLIINVMCVSSLTPITLANSLKIILLNLKSKRKKKENFKSRWMRNLRKNKRNLKRKDKRQNWNLNLKKTRVCLPPINPSLSLKLKKSPNHWELTTGYAKNALLSINCQITGALYATLKTRWWRSCFPTKNLCSKKKRKRKEAVLQ